MMICDQTVHIFPLNRPIELSYDHEIFPSKITV
jgi:hypothetical protein